MIDFGKLKDGTPMDAEYITGVIVLNERFAWELMNAVVRALPHLRADCEHMAQEHKRITADLCNELRTRVRAAKPIAQPGDDKGESPAHQDTKGADNHG